MLVSKLGGGLDAEMQNVVKLIKHIKITRIDHDQSIKGEFRALRYRKFE